MSNNSIVTLSIGNLFDSGTYIIPIYQRNYAWGEGEVKQLIQDISDYSISHPDNNYFIGTLIVYERFENGKIIYETIDGQQRLTTLNILLSVLHREFDSHIQEKINYNLNLKFDARQISTNTLNYISSVEKTVAFNTDEEYNNNIQEAYEISAKFLRNLFDDSKLIQDFYKYLRDKVCILRVSVPSDTNLNHYFEIMNTRGEQLEKHEILKATLMEVLSYDEKLSYTFSKVWDACSDMERYVQYGYTPKERDAIFTKGNWNTIFVNNFDELSNSIVFKDNSNYFHEVSADKNSNVDDKLKSINNILNIVNYNGSFDINHDHKDDAPDRFSSVINFSNFLLHVLRIQTKKDISLDDKRLLEPFDEILDSLENNDEKIVFVKEFGFSLLKCKFLFDCFIIKREFSKDKEGWSLKSLKWYDNNQVGYNNSFENKDQNDRIIMILSMFHVSTPTFIYKHWLNAALFFLFENYNSISFDKYIEWLENLAQSYLFDRYIAKEYSRDFFYNLIYINHAKSVNKLNLANQNWSNLNKGTAVENFIFNYLDYILWIEKSDDYDKFEFTTRSSVEHYYPQNPVSNIDVLDQNILDMFGNLCLISRSKNSTLGRYMPLAKKEHYFKVKPDSLKQKLMMNEEIWEEKQIEDHTVFMIDKLKNYSYAI
jgi:hypothetical protein